MIVSTLSSASAKPNTRKVLGRFRMKTRGFPIVISFTKAAESDRSRYERPSPPLPRNTPMTRLRKGTCIITRGIAQSSKSKFGYVDPESGRSQPKWALKLAAKSSMFRAGMGSETFR